MTLYHGDCLDILPTLAPQSVDAVICDPPYGTTACKWDSIIPFEPMWRELKRIIKPRGAIVLFGSQPFTSALVMSNPRWFKYSWVWRKNIPSHPGNARFMPMRYHEDILVFYDRPGTYNPIPAPRFSRASEKVCERPVRSGANKGTITGVFKPIMRQYDSLSKGPESVLDFHAVPNGGGGKLHPTQKPVALMEYLIRTYTNEGNTVLDFAAGSGTTAVAAINTGRTFIAIEQDAGYFETAQRRIAEAQQAMVQLEMVA